MRHHLLLPLALISTVVVLPSQVSAAQIETVPVEDVRPDPREEFGGASATDGDVSASIVGGTPISITSAPWQVLLVDYDPAYWSVEIGQAYWPFCGGSIINPYWVVTAAHCVDDSSTWPYLRIAAGVTTTNGISSNTFIDVARVLVHEQWNSQTSENDVALLELSSPIDLTSTSRRAIDLPTSVGGTWPSSGTNAYITGWGATSYEGNSSNALRGATIQVLASPGSGSCGSYGGSYAPASMLCAGVAGGGIDTCQGDSGGPLAILVDGKWTLGGITSWGNGCASAGLPGLCSRVTAYVAWIQSQSTVTPAAPTITSIEGRNQALRVVFDPPSGSTSSPVTNYAYSIDGGKWTSLRPAVTSGSITLIRLTNGRSYSVRIAAINARGRGADSAPVIGTPLPDPPSAPSIRSIAPGDSSATVTYNAPSNNGGSPITGYEYSVNGGGSWSSAAMGSRSSLRISGLTNGVLVSVLIRAVNMRGAGTASSSWTTTPRRVPDAPTISGAVRASTTATISFAGPAFNGGSAITTYEYSLDGGRWTALRPASTSSPFTITRLRDSRPYSLRIRAVNSAGGGAPSNTWAIAPLGSG